MNIPVAVNQRSKCFNTQTVVHPLSLQVAKGQIMGFWGPNGAGKSTTMNMIAGYLKPSQGTVCMRGYDLEKYLHQAKIGYLPEYNPLYLDMFAQDNAQNLLGMAQQKNALEKIFQQGTFLSEKN